MTDTEQSNPSVRERIERQNTTFLKDATANAKDAHLNQRGSGPKNWRERTSLEAVANSLPSFRGRDLYAIAKSLPPGSEVWDLGSGDHAAALSKLIRLHPHLRGTGITLPLEREDLSHPDNIDVIREYVDRFLRTFDRSRRPRLIYACNLFAWLPHPLSTLKHAYAALATDGILLINEIYNRKAPLIDEQGKPVDPMRLKAILQRYGYDVVMFNTGVLKNGVQRGYSVAIRKTAGFPHLKLPIKLVTPKQLGVDLSRTNQGTPFEDVPAGVEYFYQLSPDIKPPRRILTPPNLN